jgi:uncharacterized glyoxalase superfamily protein PhnB
MYDPPTSRRAGNQSSLAPAAFAPLYGMLTDRFDVTWIVGVQTPESSR